MCDFGQKMGFIQRYEQECLYKWLCKVQVLVGYYCVKNMFCILNGNTNIRREKENCFKNVIPLLFFHTANNLGPITLY
jgi:hypothetical protein